MPKIQPSPIKNQKNRQEKNRSLKIILLSCLGFTALFILLLLILAYIASRFFLSPTLLPSLMNRIDLLNLPNVTQSSSTLVNKLAQQDSDFVVNQKDTYDHHFQISTQGPTQVDIGSDSNTVVMSYGLPTKKASSGQPAWKTTWEIYQDSLTNASSDFSTFAEYRDAKSYYLLDAPGDNISGLHTDQWQLTFSLAGIKEGDTFPVRATRVGEGVTENTGPTQQWQQIIQNDSTNFQNEYSFNPSSRQTYQAGAVMSYTGTLTSDNGQQGATIQLSASQETKDQLEQIRQSANDFELLRPHMDAVTDLEMDRVYSGDFGIKPLHIVPNTN